MDYLICGLTAGVVVGLAMLALELLWLRKLTKDERRGAWWVVTLVGASFGGLGGYLGSVAANYYVLHFVR